MSGTLKTLEKPFRLSLKDRATFARQMSALMDAGLPVVKALSVIERQIHKPALKAELGQILAALQEGVSLSHAFQRWDSFMIGLLKAGETGGELPEVLDRLARFYEERFRLQNKVVTTLTYPLVIFLISLLVFMGMVVFILPQFAQVYARLGGELPAYTRFWMSVSDMARSPWGLGTLIAFIIAGYGILENREHYIISLQKALVGIPILGDVVVQFVATRFSRTLGTLLRSGVPLNRALDIADTPLFPISTMKAEVTEGIPLHAAMEKHPQLFPEMLTAMVAVGEETGELNKLLLKAADYYDQELEGLLSRLTSLIEPAIIIVLGGLIGSVVIGMYLPMFQLFNQIQ